MLSAENLFLDLAFFCGLSLTESLLLLEIKERQIFLLFFWDGTRQHCIFFFSFLLFDCILVFVIRSRKVLKGLLSLSKMEGPISSREEMMNKVQSLKGFSARR